MGLWKSSRAERIPPARLVQPDSRTTLTIELCVVAEIDGVAASQTRLEP
jgi:hypothetical protein